MPRDLNKQLRNIGNYLALSSQTLPPVIAYRNNPSLKHKLVRAKLKPIEETTQSEDTPLDSGTPKHTIQPLSTEYPYTTFKCSLQKFRNPIKRCCHAYVIICPLLETRCFAESQTLKHKFPISQPYHRQCYNCGTKNVIYLIMHNT